MKWFMAAALSLTAYFAMLRSVVAPVITGPSRLEYLFLAPTVIELLLLAAAAVLLTLAFRTFGIGVAARYGEQARAREGRWIAPLCLVSLTLVSLAVFIPGLARTGPAFVHIGYDLRFWLPAAAVLLVAREVDALMHGAPRAWLAGHVRVGPTARLLAWDAIVAAVVIAWAVITMNTMRFTGDPHGDEPKYLRYAENWYQGNGFALDSKQLMSDMPIDAPSRVTRNAALAARAAVEEAGALASDIRAFASSPRTFRWNRAKGGDNWFLTGKRGGLYQVHTPGLSVLIFPAYVLDRHFLDLRSGYQGEIAGGLFMTNLTLLLIYAAWAVVMFRLLRRLFGHDALAAGLAVLAMITLPVTSFAFQLYPETAAGLATTGVLLYVLFPREGGSGRRALAFGLACGFLPWLHIRFALLSIVLLAYAMLPRSGDWRQRRMFLAGYAALVALMCIYAYRLTGSAMPTAMFSAEGTADPFDASVIPIFFVGYMVDRIWGILPHVPVYLLAFLGLGPLWRANRAHALLFAAAWLSLAIPSSAHSLNAAGATPGRHLVAVMPLAAWPLALALRQFWGSRIVRASFIALMLLSLQAAFVYNWWHTKDAGRIWDVSISGWKVNLLFAWTHADVWETSRGNFILFLITLAVIAGLTLAGFLRRRDTRPGAVALRAWMIAAALIVVAAAGAGAAAITGDAFRDDYVQHPLVSRRLALARLAEMGRCTLCAASGRGEVDARTLTWNDVETFDVFVAPGPDRTAEIRVFARAKGGEPGFGYVRIDHGDGTSSAATAVSDLRRLTHVYRAPGTYTVRARLTLPDETTRETYTEVVIR